jgi:hypothetical protein
MAEGKFVLRPNIQQGHTVVLKPAKEFLSRDRFQRIEAVEIRVDDFANLGAVMFRAPPQR